MTTNLLPLICNVQLDYKDNWLTIVKLHHFYLLNLWNILLGGLGNNTVNFSSKTSLEGHCWVVELK